MQTSWSWRRSPRSPRCWSTSRAASRCRSSSPRSRSGSSSARRCSAWRRPTSSSSRWRPSGSRSCSSSPGWRSTSSGSRARRSRHGVAGWLISVVAGAVIAVVLHVTGVIHATVLVALALTTTAMGTLMPILRDSGILDQRFGSFVVGAGASGEFCPVVIVSIILAFEADEAWHAALLPRLRRGRRRCDGACDPHPAEAGRAPVGDDDGHLGAARDSPLGAADRRARRARLGVRPRRDPRGVRGGDHRRHRHPRHRGPRVPRQARRGRLRLPDPGLLHRDRDGLRPRRAALRPRLDRARAGIRADLPRHPRASGPAPLPA